MVHNILVAGAGTVEVNTEYHTENSYQSINDVPQGNLAWKRTDGGLGGFVLGQGAFNQYSWVLMYNGSGQYVSERWDTLDEVKWPWECAWELALGTEPLPTVTSKDTPGPDPEKSNLVIDLLTGRPFLFNKDIGGGEGSGVGSINGATGDLELVDGDGNPYEAADGKIVIPRGGGAAVETVYRIPYPVIGTAQGIWNTGASDVTWMLAGHGLAAGDLISFFNLQGGAAYMRDGSSYSVSEVVDADHFKAVFYPAPTILAPMQNAVIAADVCKLDVAELVLPALDIAKKVSYRISGDIARPADAGSITFYANAIPTPGCSTQEVTDIYIRRPDLPMQVYSTGLSSTWWATAYQLVLAAKGDPGVMAWRMEGAPFANFVPGWVAVDNAGNWTNTLVNKYNCPVKALPNQTLSFTGVRFRVANGVLCRNFKVVERVEA